MSRTPNHKCIICGVGYYSCDACERKTKPWQYLTCTQNHFRIHTIVNDYAYNVIDKAHAKRMLKKCNLDDYKNFNSNVVEILDEILSKNSELK